MLNLAGPWQVQVPADQLVNILTAIDPTSLKLHLFKNNLTPSPASVFADFTEADFDGYALKTIVAANYPTGQIMPDGSALGIFPGLQTWLDTGTVTPNTVYGWYLTDSTSSNLVCSLRFDTPKEMDGPTKFITLEFAVSIIAGGLISQADATSNG